MVTKHIAKGTRVAVIAANTQSGPFSVRLWVNCENGQLGDATLTASKAKTMRGALQSAERMVGLK